MADQPIGPILDGLGATIDLADGDLVASAVVVAKVVTADGTETLAVSDSEGLGWIEKLGLLAAANQLVRSGGFERVCDEEDDD